MPEGGGDREPQLVLRAIPFRLPKISLGSRTGDPQLKSSLILPRYDASPYHLKVDPLARGTVHSETLPIPKALSKKRKKKRPHRGTAPNTRTKIDDGGVAVGRPELDVTSLTAAQLRAVVGTAGQQNDDETRSILLQWVQEIRTVEAVRRQVQLRSSQVPLLQRLESQKPAKGLRTRTGAKLTEKASIARRTKGMVSRTGAPQPRLRAKEDRRKERGRQRSIPASPTPLTQRRSERRSAKSLPAATQAKTAKFAFQPFQWDEQDHQAARVLQRWRRNVLWRRQQVLVRIQSFFRGRIARRVVNKIWQRKSGAALRIQRLIRGKLAQITAQRLRRVRRHYAARDLQRVHRGRWARRHTQGLRDKRCESMATRIQSIARGRQTRKKVQKKRVYAAAVDLQRCYRGFRTRHDRGRRRRMMNIMAQRVKAPFRGHRGRRWARLRAFQVQANSSLKLQRCLRGHLARIYARICNRAVRAVHRSLRTYMGRKSFESIRLRAENAKVRPMGVAELVRCRKWITTKEGHIRMKVAKRQVKAAQAGMRKMTRSMSPEDREKHALKQTFNLIDMDGSGTVERDEFEEMITKMCEYMKPEEIDKAWGKIDVDGSGCIDFDEFSTWWTNHAHGTGAIATAIRLRLKIGSAISSLIGADVSKATLRKVLLDDKTKVMRKGREEFRKRIKPPFACKKCMRSFLSSYSCSSHVKNARCEEQDLIRL